MGLIFQEALSKPVRQIQAQLAPFQRVRLFQADCQRESHVLATGLAPRSMDLIIDDASHELSSQERTLHVMWTFLRAGGIYVIEDMGLIILYIYCYRY